MRVLKTSKAQQSQAPEACGVVTRTTRAAAVPSDRTLRRLGVADAIGIGLLVWALLRCAVGAYELGALWGLW